MSKARLTDKPTQATRITARQDVVADLTELRTQLVALLAKLDLDGGVSDSDFASLLTPAALKTQA